MTAATQNAQSGVHPASPERYDVVVVGAGFAGLYALYWFREKLGLRVRVLEKGGDVGGTWYWNRYPGARCDSESVYYCFSDHMPPEILQEWTWSERYARQPEILAYLRWVADKLDLRRDIDLNTAVTAAHYDENANVWRIATANGRIVEAPYFVTAVGCLHAAHLPQFEGLERFQGRWYHTADWPEEGVDFTGRRVGVIGTGATAVQVIPEVAGVAEHVYVFQRTPNHCIPGRNRRLTPEEIAEIKRNYPKIWQKMRQNRGGFPFDPATRSALETPPEERRQVYERAWEKGGLAFTQECFNDLGLNEEANRTAVEFFAEKIREIVRDPNVADLLTPKYPFGTKRPPLEHGYYETFNRPNVTLVDVRTSPIVRITPRGIETADREYELDDIVFATGFDAMTGALFAIDIRGRGGVSLKEYWAEGPRTYLGLTTHGFPNMFIITGPQSPSVLTNMVVSIEQHVEWIGACIEYMREHGYDVIEATAEAEQSWVDHHNQVASMTLLLKTDSWWVGANIPGKQRLVYPYVGGLDVYRAFCDNVAATGYQGFRLQSRAAAHA
ncbi:Phenylacetone monooxygenase [bacterium HR29]|jgi:cation diffusion facilitator CzcD-associated flavoprotein CzcO|nr:Phenylacetone monooxygenase [bacterium HR29]